MFHYLHQLVPNCVSLLYGAGHVAHSGFIKVFSLKTAAWLTRKKTNTNESSVTLNGDIKGVGYKIKTVG